MKWDVVAVVGMIAGAVLLAFSIAALPVSQTTVIPVRVRSGDCEPALTVSVSLDLPEGVALETIEGKVILSIDNDVITRGNNVERNDAARSLS